MKSATRNLTLLIAAIGFGVSPGFALFMWEETRQVPVARLLANLEQRLARNTNDVESLYYLGRIHSLAYATNLTELSATTNGLKPVFGLPDDDPGVPQVVIQPTNAAARAQSRQHLTNAIAYYETAVRLLPRSTNLYAEAWLLPSQLGLGWCLDQAGRRDEALKAYRRALQMAWQAEVVGDFNLKDWLNEAVQNVRAGHPPPDPTRRTYLGPGVCYSREIIDYLLKLLDPKKDAREIADLKARQATLVTMGRAVTPMVVPLADGLELPDLINPAARVAFDLDGSGLPRSWQWLKPTAAWLVYDHDGSGRIDSGLQLIGAVTWWIFWRDGYEALSALDDDGDGVIRGAELRGLALWHDRDGDGVSDPGEVRSVEACGIVALSCSWQSHSTGIPFNPAGATFRDGSTRPTFDWIASSDPEGLAASTPPDTASHRP